MYVLVGGGAWGWVHTLSIFIYSSPIYACGQVACKYRHVMVYTLHAELAFINFVHTVSFRESCSSMMSQTRSPLTTLETGLGTLRRCVVQESVRERER